jgi:hypothetical protein
MRKPTMTVSPRPQLQKEPPTPPADTTTTTNNTATAVTTNSTTTGTMPPLLSPPLGNGGGGENETHQEENVAMTVGTMATGHSTPPAESTATCTSTLTGSTQVPVTESNGRQWFDGNTDAEVNGKPSSKFWKLVDQYGRGH